MVDRELLTSVLNRYEMSRDIPTGVEFDVLVDASRAYLEIPDPQLVKLLNDLGETRAILMRNAQQNAGSKDGEILTAMLNTVTAAQTVIQQAMFRAQQ